MISCASLQLYWFCLATVFLLLGKNDQEPLFRLTHIWRDGDVALDVFFIISGYLITRSFLIHKQNYWRNRVLRLIPALIVNVLITVFILGPVFTALKSVEYFTSMQTYYYLINMLPIIFCWSLPGVFNSNTSIMVNGSLWTLGCEVIMYILIWGIGITQLSFKKILPLMVFVFIFLSWADISYFGLNILSLRITVLPYTQLALEFTIGCGFYIFRDYIAFTPFFLFLTTVISLGAYFLGAPNFIPCILLPYATIYFAFSKTINLHQTARYGDLSYGVYIYSYMVQQMLITLTGGKITQLELFFSSLVISLFLAFASWHLVEKHALKLKKKP